VVNFFVFAYPVEKIAQPGRGVGAIKFFDRITFIPTNGNTMLLAADINGDVELCVHVNLSLNNATRQNRLCALPTQEPHLLASSRQALQTMRMTGAAFQT